METYTEIQHAEGERRQRATRYERLLGDRDRLAREIEKLASMPESTTALEQMLALVGDVPTGLTTRGSRFQSGGFDVRDLLMGIVSNALDDAKRKADDVTSALDHATRELARVETALVEFE